MDPDYFVIGLRYLLDIHGLSDRKAAEACGVSQPTLSDILAGRSEGRLKNREKIARAWAGPMPRCWTSAGNRWTRH